MVFDEFEKRKDMQYNAYVSYLEIYNENGYDLLDKKHAETGIDKWSKISLFEDDYGNIHMKNLSIHKCETEDDAIDLLMMGNFIRQVSATPMNQASSRSHCVFTMALECRDRVHNVIRTSKLHLVDLAGSERVYKRNTQGGTIVEEAKYINLSLTYLEQVIVALHDKAKGNRVHIPYRNSMMTTILRDSLGGNCRTVMVATLGSELDNIDESVSTARFAQRCAMLVNEVYVNQHEDLNLMIRRLEEENSRLKVELGHAGSGGESLRRDLTVDEEAKTETTINGFLAGREDREPNLGSREELMHCIRYMKQLILDKDAKYGKEVSVLKEQINDLKRKLGEYLAKESTVSFNPSRIVNKENSVEDMPGVIGGCGRQVELQGESFEMKKKKMSFSRQAVAHGCVPQFGPRGDNGVYIGDSYA